MGQTWPGPLYKEYLSSLYLFFSLLHSFFSSFLLYHHIPYPSCFPVLALGSSAALKGFIESGLSLGLERPLGLRLLELPRATGPSAQGSSHLLALLPGSLFHSVCSRQHSLSGSPLRSCLGPLCVFPVTRFFESWLKMRSSFHFSGIWRA